MLTIGACVSLCASVFILFECPEVELPGHLVFYIFYILRTLHTVSTVAASLDHPTNSAHKFPFLHILSNT